MTDVYITREHLLDWYDAFVKTNNLICQDGPPRSKDDNGNPYVTVTLGGPKQEGRPSPIGLTIHDQKFAMFGMDLLGTEILKWLNGRKHVIWRERPNASVYAHPTPEWDTGNVVPSSINEYLFRCRLTAY